MATGEGRQPLTRSTHAAQSVSATPGIRTRSLWIVDTGDATSAYRRGTVMLKNILATCLILAIGAGTASADADSEAIRKYGLYDSEWAYIGKCAVFKTIFAETSNGTPEVYTKMNSGAIKDREIISKVRAMPGDRLSFETSGGRARIYVVYEKIGKRIRIFESRDLDNGQVFTKSGRLTFGNKQESPLLEKCL